MSIPAAADRRQLYGELRSLAGNTRAAIDALVAAWYLEFRVRTARTFSQWTDPALREIAAALVLGADARPGCARLGASRALAGFSDAEVRDDLASLAQTVATDPTLDPPPSDDLLAAALAGWHAASGPRARPPARTEDLPGAAHLLRLLRRLIDDGSGPEPVVAVVDVGAAGSAGTALDVTSALDHLEAAGPGPIGVGWFELVAGSRYGVVARRTRGTAHTLAVLRGALRVAPEFAGRSVHVWIEVVPRTAAALPDFVQRLGGDVDPGHRRRVRAARPHRDVARPIRTRGRSRTRHAHVRSLPERWLASAAALLLVAVAVGTLNVEPVLDGPGTDSPAPGPAVVGPDPVAPGAEQALRPASGGVTGVAVGGTGTPAPDSSTAEEPPAPVALDPSPVAHVEPVVPDPTDGPADPSPAPAPAPAPPPSPDVAPAPGPTAPDETPRTPRGPPSDPGPPEHALRSVPDHAPPKAAGHPSSRARMTRM